MTIILWTFAVIGFFTTLALIIGAIADCRRSREPFTREVFLSTGGHCHEIDISDFVTVCASDRKVDRRFQRRDKRGRFIRSKK